MSHHIETSQLICSANQANQLTGFYMMGTLVVKGLMQLYDTSRNVRKPLKHFSRQLYVTHKILALKFVFSDKILMKVRKI